MDDQGVSLVSSSVSKERRRLKLFIDASPAEMYVHEHLVGNFFDKRKTDLREVLWSTGYNKIRYEKVAIGLIPICTFETESKDF